MKLLSKLSAWLDKVTAKLKGYRTELFAWLALVAPPTAALIASNLAGIDWTQYIPSSWIPFWSIGVGVIVLWLRSITSTPAGTK